MNENESLTVTLTLENDEELECAVLTIFETDGREYIALLPLDENGDNDDGQVYLYRFIDNGDFHTSAYAGIQSHGHFRTCRCRQQKGLEIGRKNRNGFCLGFFPQFAKQFRFKMGQYPDTPCPSDGFT